jgi:uncharacterized integral membrane protein
MTRLRTWIGLGAAALAVLLILQNFDPVGLSFLFWTFEVPLALVVVLALFIGAALGAWLGRRL